MFVDPASQVVPDPTRFEHYVATLGDFAPISLVDIEAAALLNRIDSKFIVASSQIANILPFVSDAYRILTIGQRRQHRYRTLYFDTADFNLYQRHHSGARQRYKVRSRQYLDTNLAFFEIKYKINSNRTKKYRLPTLSMLTRLNDEAIRFMDAYGIAMPSPLSSKLSNDFNRITLVDHQASERITIDLNIRFNGNNTTAELSKIAIIEIKQAFINHQSPFLQQLRLVNIHQHSFSKYCVGAALLYPYLKHNTIKPALQRVNSLMGGVYA